MVTVREVSWREWLKLAPGEVGIVEFEDEKFPPEIQWLLKLLSERGFDGGLSQEEFDRAGNIDPDLVWIETEVADRLVHVDGSPASEAERAEWSLDVKREEEGKELLREGRGEEEWEGEGEWWEDPDEVIDGLRHERYLIQTPSLGGRWNVEKVLRRELQKVLLREREETNGNENGD